MKGLRWLLYLPFCKWGIGQYYNIQGPRLLSRERDALCNIV